MISMRVTRASAAAVMAMSTRPTVATFIERLHPVLAMRFFRPPEGLGGQGARAHAGMHHTSRRASPHPVILRDCEKNSDLILRACDAFGSGAYGSCGAF